MAGVDEYARTMLTRSGTDRLPAHLTATYGIEVAALSELDLGVFQVDQTDGPAWVARVFPAARTGGAAAGDAAVLNFLADAGFAAERLAAPQPVSVLDRQDVLVTGCELDRLAAVMCVRPSIFEVWAFCTGRKTAADAARAITEIRRLSDTLATRAHDEFRAVA